MNQDTLARIMQAPGVALRKCSCFQGHYSNPHPGCDICHGLGVIEEAGDCPGCKGRGYTPDPGHGWGDSDCPDCNGSGVIVGAREKIEFIGVECGNCQQKFNATIVNGDDVVQCPGCKCRIHAKQPGMPPAGIDGTGHLSPGALVIEAVERCKSLFHFPIHTWVPNPSPPCPRCCTDGYLLPAPGVVEVDLPWPPSNEPSRVWACGVPVPATVHAGVDGDPHRKPVPCRKQPAWRHREPGGYEPGRCADHPPKVRIFIHPDPAPRLCRAGDVTAEEWRASPFGFIKAPPQMSWPERHPECPWPDGMVAIYRASKVEDPQ